MRGLWPVIGNPCHCEKEFTEMDRLKGDPDLEEFLLPEIIILFEDRVLISIGEEVILFFSNFQINFDLREVWIKFKLVKKLK